SAPGRPSASAAFHRPQLWMRAQARSPRPIRLSARTISRSSNKAGKNMIDEHFEGRSGSRHYSRWPDPWRREDDWGPITAAVLFFVILAGLVVYGSGAHLFVAIPRRPQAAPVDAWRAQAAASVR